MAAPIIFLQPVDREGLTVEEYDEINQYWENEQQRLKQYHQLILRRMAPTLEFDVPKGRKDDQAIECCRLPSTRSLLFADPSLGAARLELICFAILLQSY